MAVLNPPLWDSRKRTSKSKISIVFWRNCRVVLSGLHPRGTQSISNLVGTNAPHADGTIGPATEESAAISRPLKAHAEGEGSVLANGGELRAELVNNDLGLKVPDLDAGVGGGAEPVAIGAEDKGVDDVTSFKGVKLLALVEVPEHGNTVLATGSSEGTVRGAGYGVKVASVAGKVGTELAVGEVPNLDHLVPSGGDDEGVGGGGGEAYAGNPLGVAALVDGVLALTKGVPELDGLVTGARNNLSVVKGEGNGKNVLGVSDEATGGVAGVKVPKAKGAVPGAGEAELAIGGNDHILNEVGVAGEGAAGEAVVGALTGEGPDNDALVAGSREDHTGVLTGGGNRSHPVGVVVHFTAEYKGFGHFSG